MRVVGGVVSSDALRDGLLFALSPALRAGLEAAKPSVCCFIVVAEFERRAGADFGAFNGFEPEDVVMVEGKNEVTGGASKSESVLKTLTHYNVYYVFRATAC